MPNVTISVTEEIKQKMEAHPEINWSEVGRSCIEKKLEEMSRIEQKPEIVRKLEEILNPALNKKEAEELSAKDAEISRFVTRWGKPEPSSGFRTEQSPYVFLSAKLNLATSKGKMKGLKVTNIKNVEKMYSPLWREPDSKLWDDETNTLIGAFRTLGFQVKERPFADAEEVGLRLYPEGEGSHKVRRDFGNELLSRYILYAIFAFNNEDEVFLGHRQEKR